MGDVRFRASYLKVKEASHRERALVAMTDEEVVAGLAGAVREGDPYLANVLGTEALNRTRRTNTILGTLGEAVAALDADGRVAYLNPAAERLLGVEAADASGRDFHGLVRHRRAPDGAIDRLEDAVLPPDECRLLRVLESLEADAVDEDDVFTRKDGRPFAVAYTVAPIVNEEECGGAVVVFRDVTEERSERRRRIFLEAAVERAPVAAYWVREDGSIAYVNRKAAEDLRRDRGDLERLTVFDVDGRMTREAWPDHWRRVKGDGVMVKRSELRRSDGAALPVLLSINHLEHAGEEFHCTFAVPVDG